MATSTISKGECEVCGKEDVKLRLQKTGNIMMCEDCYAQEQATITENAKAVVVTSQKIDSTIQLKADIFNAATTSFHDLQSAILANAEIAVEKKNETLLAEVAARIDVLDAAIFQHKSELAAKQNERNALLTSAQQVHARLRASEQAKFKQFDVSYKPAVSKVTPKPKTPKSVAGKKYSISLVRMAAETHKVPASSVQTAILSKGLNPETAAIYIHKMIYDTKESAEAYLQTLK